MTMDDGMTVTGRETPCLHLDERNERCDILGPERIPAECPTCPAYVAGYTEQERTRCEVWTRVMGYHRPISAANPGKQAEHSERVYFKELPSEPVSSKELT